MMAAPVKDSLVMNENDLKSTLMNQKLRAEQHRSNYETLKAQHILLQKDHVALQSEYKSSLGQYDMMKNKFEEIIGQLQHERDDKIAECEQVKTQVLTEQKLDVIKLRVAEEIEAPYRKHVQLMENELEAFRSDYNKLRYNYSFLKSEHENIKSKHQTIVEEMQARHQAEISRYQNERKELLSRQEQDIPATIKQTRQLQRENTGLEQRVKSLLSQLEENEHKMEQANTASEQSNRSLSRKINEVEAINQSLEREATTLREHIKRLQDEIAQTHKQHLSVSEEVMAAQRENTSLQRQIDDVAHSQKAAISELTMKHAQQCSELTRQRDSAVSELESCRSRIEVMEQAFHQQETSLANMNKELERRVQEVKEQEWNKIAVLQQDKMQLEEELSKARKLSAHGLSDQHALTTKFRDEIRQLEIDKAAVKEELEELQSQSQRQASQLKNCQQELLSLRGTQKKYQSLQADHHNLEDNKQQLQITCDKLQSTVKLLEEQLGVVKMEAQKGRYEYAAAMDKQKKLWEEECCQLMSKLSDYKERLKSSQTKLTSSQDTNRKRRKLYKQKTQELKRKIELLQAKEEQLVLERDTIKKLHDVQSEKMKRKFLEIQRRQKEFHFLLQQDHTQPLVVGEPAMLAPLKNLTNQEQQHKRELQDVHDRLEEIATVTRKHAHRSISSDSLVSNHSDDHSQS